MKNKVFYLNNEKTAYVKAYLLDKVESIPFGEKRPAIIIFPGGGYEYCSGREAEPIAMRYLAEGYNAFVLYYTCNKKFPAPLINAAYAMFKIRARADEFNIDKDKIAVWGASAGGHLAGCLATMWGDAAIYNTIGCEPQDIRPNAAILSYPVISGITSPHVGSFEVLLGKDAKASDLSRLSLENRVTPKTPPVLYGAAPTTAVFPPITALFSPRPAFPTRCLVSFICLTTALTDFRTAQKTRAGMSIFITITVSSGYKCPFASLKNIWESDLC